MEPKQIHDETMAVTLSVKNVPEKLAERLRQRAASHHRSLQGELLGHPLRGRAAHAHH